MTTVINTFSFFLRKIRLDISCESSARQRIQMKHQALFSSKNKRKKTKVLSAAIFVWRLKGEDLTSRSRHIKAVRVWVCASAKDE